MVNATDRWDGAIRRTGEKSTTERGAEGGLYRRWFLDLSYERGADQSSIRAGSFEAPFASRKASCGTK
jgi:hypothetical protein